VLQTKPHVINQKMVDVKPASPKQYIQQKDFGNNSNDFGPMNAQLNIGTAFDNFNSHEIMLQNYSSQSYNNTPQQQTQAGGPIGARRE